ncbi:MAG: universal stress protein [Myxococcales bacterium]|nr:universal stress protein [Myxococcales bacterium]MCB9671587.1 universal stress protein [Alphaproteobacteria bacterium]MCB9691823.1 universal stress protein [Alphaproteobacteria bacterium]
MAFESIWLATDLGKEAIGPWAHALRICVASSTDLRVLHVRQGTVPDWTQLPSPRRLLTGWGFVPEDASLDDFAALGIHVRMQALEAEHPVGLLAAMIHVEEPDLLVLGTHRPHGVERLLEGSVGETLARRAPGAALLVPDGARPFVVPDDGTLRLRKILVPAGEAGAQHGIDAALQLLDALGVASAEIVLVYVGAAETAPLLRTPERDGVHWRYVRYADGPIVGRILETATAEDVDLIAMATHGRDSWWDGVWGSRTERVLRDAAVPVLAATIPD